MNPVDQNSSSGLKCDFRKFRIRTAEGQFQPTQKSEAAAAKAAKKYRNARPCCSKMLLDMAWAVLDRENDQNTPVKSRNLEKLLLGFVRALKYVIHGPFMIASKMYINYAIV